MKTPTVKPLLLLNLFMVSCNLIMWSIVLQKWHSLRFYIARSGVS